MQRTFIVIPSIILGIAVHLCACTGCGEDIIVGDADADDLDSEDPRPHGCQKLSGKDRYRLRQGVYRIVYSIHDDRLVVQVVKVGHR